MENNNKENQEIKPEIEAPNPSKKTDTPPSIVSSEGAKSQDGSLKNGSVSPKA